MRFFNLVYYFIDCLILVGFSIGLVEIHLFLSCVGIVIASIYSGIKLYDYLKERKASKKMGKTAKAIVLIILELLVLGIIFLFIRSKESKSMVFVPTVDDQQVVVTDNTPSIIGKSAFASEDDVTVYNLDNTIRKVINKKDWAGTVTGQNGNVLILLFSDTTKGWVTKQQVNIQ